MLVPAFLEILRRVTVFNGIPTLKRFIVHTKVNSNSRVVSDTIDQKMAIILK